MKRILLPFIMVVSMSASLRAAEFKEPYVQWVPDNSKNTAAFMTVVNTTDKNKKIVRAESEQARAVELHEHTMEGGMMQMKPVPHVNVPAKSETSFNPDGYHIMLIGLKKKLSEGEKIKITIHFDDGEKAPVEFTVKSDKSAAPAMDHSLHGAGHQHHLVADMVPPAGVMGAHMHSVGSWILDYRVMAMEMNKLMDENHEQMPLQVLYGVYRNPTVQMPMTGLRPPSPFLPRAKIEENEYRYMSVGMDMTMEMRMFSPMYQYSENTMIMLMVPYIMNRMTMLANNFQTAEMIAKGVGDASLSAVFRIWSRGNHALFLGTGIAVPTGSIDEKAWMPQMGKSQVGYAMQPGVGTYSFLGQAAYTGRMDSLKISWGLQMDATVRAGKNDNNYRAGNRYNGTLWGSYRFTNWISASLRAQNQFWENYAGQDPALDPTMDPGNDPKLQGGHRTDVFAGINLIITRGSFAGMRFFIETGKPTSQHLNGPQMAVNWTTNAGLQYAL